MGLMLTYNCTDFRVLPLFFYLLSQVSLVQYSRLAAWTCVYFLCLSLTSVSLLLPAVFTFDCQR